MADEDPAKQLKVEDHVHTDADFMAAIDEQMEALARRRRGRKPPVKTTLSEIKDVSPAKETISVRRDAVTNPLSEKQAEIHETDSPLHLSHNAPDLQPLHESPPAVTSPDSPSLAVKPVPPLEEQPKVMDVRAAPKPATAVRPAIVPQEAAVESIDLPDLSHPVSAPEIVVKTEKTEKEDLPLPKPVLNTEKLASQVKRDPDLETISADVPEEAPARVLSSEYHLPIHQSHIKRHHPPVNTLVAIGLFLLLGSFITAIAIDMELIDLGFELPFDFF